MEKVTRVEQTGLGTVFMCTHGGSRYGSNGCRRTYLSQRDLQAHINHRHVTSSTQPIEQQPEPERPPIRPPKSNDPRGSISISTSIRHRSNTIQSSTGVRTNLITVPIQDSAPIVHDTSQQQNYYNQYQPTTAYNQAQLPPMHIPPPQQTQYYAAPPAYSPAQTYPAYANTAPPPTSQYTTSAVAQSVRPTQYDYTSAPPPQWPSNQYFR